MAHEPNLKLQKAMGRALAKAMDGRNVSAPELAARTGAGKQNINEIRSGRNCSLNMWHCLCDGLGIRFWRISRAAEIEMKKMEGDK